MSGFPDGWMLLGIVEPAGTSAEVHAFIAERLQALGVQRGLVDDDELRIDTMRGLDPEGRLAYGCRVWLATDALRRLDLPTRAPAK
jgi:hypothetical protein